MKTKLFGTRLLVAAGAILGLSSSVIFATDTNHPSGQAASGEAAGQPAAVTSSSETSGKVTVKLPYGVDEVVKLSRAQVGEDVTLTYIKNSGTIYGLSAQDIVYLKNEGVSDKVINAMQDQRKLVYEASATTTATASQPVAYSAPTVQQGPMYVQEPDYYDSIAVTEPDYAPGSSLYIIPYPTSTYPRYAYASSYPRGPYFGFHAFGGPGFRGGPFHGGRPASPYMFGGASRGAGPGRGGAHIGGGGGHGGGGRPGGPHR